MEFTATIYLLNTDEGGRKSPIFSGYRPAFYFGDKQTDGAILFDDQEPIFPGEKREVKVRVLHPETLEDVLKPNAVFEFKEGFKVVGRGAVERRPVLLKHVRYALYVHYDALWQEGFETWKQSCTNNRSNDLPDGLQVVDDFSVHLEHLHRLLQNEIESPPGVLILFLDYGLGSMLTEISDAGLPDKHAKSGLEEKIPELKFAELVRKKVWELTRIQGVEQCIRVLTPLDLVYIFKNMSQVSVLKYVVGAEGQVRYDSPNFIEAIVRARLLGSGIPVFRVDRNVLLPERDEGFYPHYYQQLASAITELIKALNEHQRHNRILSTIMSCNYERPSSDDDDVIAWYRGYTT